ncbi:SWI/SNF-related matrix-associated actin-dependent regulator of chromatin subfamily D member 1-like isoform X1 [Hydractinia symbiolongicarpus]|uniref:SWI/SNF-related matrix-associated actin-dependent regulator of chromatin subfamily D member 1-like isoform X1 n=2 Tax=Hydractinia symbiolongicarpus TaxID=13093 RepID=UPI00254D6FC3|nr:SWI/SNF-related matrix-associated actin-dependent regulator of chromatin subfamily D member 1-like isoform X1 [Hydractinia symbiolongicarpus]
MFRPGLQGSPGPNMTGNWQRNMRASQSPAGMQMRQQNMGGQHTPEGVKRSSDGKSRSKSSKKRKIKDRIITQQVIELVPESQAYMDLLAFENKLDSTIMRKRLDIQEALKRPVKQKRTLRIFVSTNFYQPKAEDATRETFPAAVPEWEVRIEGRLIDDPLLQQKENNQKKKKFSCFFKNLVIELDRDIYGPDNHLVEWHRTTGTQETDGFQVKRPLSVNKSIKCSIYMMMEYQPSKFKLSAQLARVLGIHTQTRPMIISTLWQYIKRNKLQDPEEREYVTCDKYLKEIFSCDRMKFCEIPQRLQVHLLPPDPIIIHYTVDPSKPEDKNPSCFDIDIDLDDSLRDIMQSFLLSTASQQEIASLESKIHETVEGINQLKVHRDFFLSFSTNPQKFMNDWLTSQCADLKTMTDVSGNPEEERTSEFYNQPWAEEAVHRYFYRQVQLKRAELEQALGIRN